MNFEQILLQVTEVLRREERVSYRALKRRFEVDDALLEDLKAELVDAKRLAVDEEGKVLVWRLPSRPAAKPQKEVEAEKPRPSPRLGLERPTPRSYTPAHLVREVLKRRNALEGERKQVTVLFCDVVDSTGLARKLDPEVMHAMMDRVLTLAAKVVHRYGGTVNQFLGDGLMALFGAPLALEDHAVRCAHAALGIHDAIRVDSANLGREHGAEVRLRIGVNSGEVVVGRIGDDLRMDYTAAGNTTYLAERLQAIAEPGSTYIAEATQRLVSGYVVTEPLGPQTLRGQIEPVNTYRLVKRQRRRNRFQVLAERGLTSLVGRARELSLLADRFELSRSGRGQVVGVVGDAGVGKSRIVHEFVRRYAGDFRDDVVCLSGQCAGHTLATPYGPIIEMLRTVFHVDEGDELQAIHDKVGRGLLELDAALAEVEPLVCELLSPGAGDEAGLKHVDPSETRKRLLEALIAIAKAILAKRPGIMLVEDVQWIDPSSERCINALVQNLGTLPLLLILTHRTGYGFPWSTSRHYTQIPVDEFTPDETDTMLGEILGKDEVPPGLRKLVHNKVGGNPLFVEEIMRSLLERGLVAGASNGGTLPRDVPADIELPPTVQDVVRARIDELHEPPRRAVQAAAAIGPVFSARLLSQLPGLDGETEQSLEIANGMGLIQEHRLFPEHEYAFKHAVVQDVAYQMLLASARRELHGQIARAIEELWAERIEEQLAALAYHYSHSDDNAKALTYSMLAGERAERFHARPEAIAHYVVALGTARALPDSPESRRAQIDAIVRLAAVAHTREHMDRDERNLEWAQGAAEALADERRLAQVLYWRGRLHYARAAFAEALECAQRCIALSDGLRDEALAAPAVNLEGRVRWQHGDYGKAAQLLVRSTQQMRALGNASEEATAAGFTGWTFAFLGEFDDALEYTARGLRLACDLQNPFSQSAAHFYRGAVFDQQGAWSDALAEYEKGIHIAEEAGDTFRQYLIKCQKGRAYVMAGDLRQGRAVLEDAVALAGRLGTSFVLAWPKAYLAHCQLEQGDCAAERALAEQAPQSAQKAGDKYGQFMAYRSLAGALAAQAAPDYERAEEALRQSIRLQHEMAIKPELGRTYVQYADLCRRQGKTGQAKAYLNVAIDIFRQPGMSWDLERAQSALAALG